MDKGLLAVILVASVCIGLVLSVFGAMLLVGFDVLFSPSKPAGNGVAGLFFAVMLVSALLIALSFRGGKAGRKRR